MKLKFVYVGLVGIVLTMAIVLIYPMLKGEAQQSREKVEERNEALQKVRENVTASIFYDNVLTKDSEWNLRLVAVRDSTTLIFEKSGKDAKVFFREYDSIDDAKKDFSNLAINARVESYNKQGDQGRKIYHIYGNGGFSNLGFRKGRFYVSISCEDEKTAERFAVYASDSITQ